MLSVGIVASGGVGYYMQTVGSGVDDYYARAEPGRWIGAGAADLGLAGEVRPGQVDALAGGRHPITEDPLGVTVGKVAAFDLTFSAPKSVSLMAELAEPGTRHEFAQAHLAAVQATLRFIEDEGVLAGRRGHGGTRQIATQGAVAAAFEHRTSRAGDPQLHTHLLVFNRAKGADGLWRGIYGRRLFAWAKTAGYVYQAALRAELTERLGVAWQTPVNGMAEIRGVPERALEAFSTRRAEIEAALAERGQATARSAQIATLATRGAKPEGLDPSVQRVAWWERATEAGLRPQHLECAIDQAPRQLHPAQPDDLARRLTAPDGLTAHRSHFDRREVIQAVAQDSITGLRPSDVATATNAVLTTEQIINLGTEHRFAGPIYSTVEVVELEARLLDAAERAQANSRAICEPAKVERAITARPTLSAEQQRMVRHLCSAGDGVLVVVGRAGTGKTFALDACRQAWTASGITVVGAALAARTAAGLQAGTGIPSTTVDQLLSDLGRPGSQAALPRDGVLVVDEAGMVGTRKLAALAVAAERYHCTLVLVGDPRQLPEIEAGGAFAALAVRSGVELTENRRQVNTWEREALAQLRHGDVGKAVSVYREHGRITLAATAEEARTRLVDDWWATRNPGQRDRTAMIALHQVDVDELNARARSKLEAVGQLRGPELEAANTKRFAAGDEILTLRNDRRLGVTNGTRAQVTGVDVGNRSITARTTDGREVTITGEYIDAGHLTHGYALTAHKAQGVTVGRAFVLGSDRLYREAGYTSLSRATDQTDLYHVAPPQVGWHPRVDPHAQLTASLSRSAAQTLAIDQIGQLPPDRETLTAIRDAALADPGQHLVDRLGPPPPAGREREMWAAAATAIDAYRDRYGITGPDCLGPRPETNRLDGATQFGRETQLEQTRAYEHAEALVRQTERHLEQTLETDLGLSR
ncbi:MAG TPA: MobF family relaxase [Acidimicrobiales bacterium]|nr:MobF family relaxase [Acidimicrobiales bacterium]